MGNLRYDSLAAAAHPSRMRALTLDKGLANVGSQNRQFLMDGSIPPPMPILPNGARMSLAARLTNVFSGPGEVFEAIAKGPPSTGNWLAPALLSCVLGIVSTMVIFSQDNVVQQIRDQQAQVLERKLEKLPKE